MVPSGDLLPAKMAPAGAQMGSGNLINAGIVKKGGQEAEKVGKNPPRRAQEHAGRYAAQRYGGESGGGKMGAGPRVRLKPAADLIHLAQSEEEKDQRQVRWKRKPRQQGGLGRARLALECALKPTPPPLEERGQHT